MDDWTHGRKKNYGLAVKAFTTDSRGWKQFGSTRYPNGKPSLDITWSKYGAVYKPGQLITPVTATGEGAQRITVTNQGRETWRKDGNYQLTYRLYDSAGTELTSSSLRRYTTMPRDVAPGSSVTLDAKIAPLNPGTYTLVWTMTDYGVRRFTTEGIPGAAVRISTSNIPPQLVAAAPGSGAVFDTLTPTLWARGTDPDHYPSALRYTFEVCDVEGDNARKNCRQSSRITSQQWAVPSEWLAWEKSYAWYAYVYDGKDTSLRPNPAFFTTRVPQPAVTGHLGGENGKDFGARTGNYSTAATDASVTTVGPELAVHRAYNSLDPRTDTAFGRGWSSRWDMRAVAENTGNVVVTLASGRRVRFGRNANGTYTSPAGSGDTLVATSGGGWTLRTSSATTYTFDSTGSLTRITDGAGREQRLTHESGKLTTAHDVASERTLAFTWEGDRVSSVTTSAVGPDEPGLTWTYTYRDGLLAEVCPPEPQRGCTEYEYDEGSLYRSTVLDANPVAYWPLGESTGETAESVAPSRTGLGHAAHYDVEYGVPGALAGSTDTAIAFNGTDSHVELPHDILSASTFLSIELWFRTTDSGVLVGFQNSPLDEGSPEQRNPPLTVDADGKLSGFLYTGSVDAIDPIKSAETVTDNEWHHAVLTAAGTTQTLYLDGRRVGSREGPLDHRELSYTYLGAGWSDSRWDGGPSEVRRFTGHMDDVAVYHHPLDATTVAEHHAAGRSTGRLIRVSPPSGRAHAEVEYDTVTGRLREYTDENGGTWQVSDPAYGNGSRGFADTVLTDAPTGYWRLDDRASAVAHSETGDDVNGVYNNLPRRGAGPFAEGDTSAPVFDGSTVVEVPNEAWGETDEQAVELWFRTEESGVLVAMQDAEFGETPTGWWPMLLVDDDGRLRGRFRYPGDSTSLVSTHYVDDGKWHHVILAATADSQVLYIDGVRHGWNSHGTDSNRLTHTYIGGGYASASWNGRAGGYHNFSGQIADVAFYDHSLISPRTNWWDGRTKVLERWRLRSSLLSGTGTAYRNTVIGSAPAAYWRFEETSGVRAADETGRHPAVASESGVLHTYWGPFGGGGTTAARFTSEGQYVEIPGDILAGTRDLTAELWFRTNRPRGVLLGFQNQPIGQTPSSWRAVLNIDVDGKLRGEWYAPLSGGGARTITSPQTVTDDQWHHVVLSGSGNTQTLYLDGVKVGTLEGTILEQSRPYAYLGGGHGSSGWMGAPGNTYYFNGALDEVALYRHSLTEEQVTAHYLARSNPEHHSLGATVTVTDPMGETSSTTYAPLNGWRTVASTDAEGGVTTFAYDTGGFLHTVTDPNGNSTITGHDAAGNAVSTTTCRAPNDCQTSFASYHHDASELLDPRNGKPLSTSDARSSGPADTTYRTSMTYTASGLPATTTLADGRTSTRTYTTGTEPAIGGGTVPPDLVASIRAFGGSATHYEYFATGDVARVTEASGIVTDFTYDGLGRKLSETVVSEDHPDGLTSTFVHDSLSRIVTETGVPVENEVTGETHTMEIRRTFDGDGRLRTETVADSTGGDAERTTSYRYDAHGLNREVIDAEGNSTFFVHDDLGRVARVTDASGVSVRSTYTPRGRLAETTLEDWEGDPEGGVRDLVLESRAYDPAGRLASVTDALGATVVHTYFDDGLPATITALDVVDKDGNPRDIVLEENLYDPAGQLVRQVTGDGATEVARALDATGRVTATVLDPEGLNRRTTFTHDDEDRLLTRTRHGSDGDLVDTFTYDHLGNLLTETIAGPGDSTTVAHSYNQLGLRTATVAPLGMVEDADPAPHTTEFRYDALGREAAVLSPEVTVERHGEPAADTRLETLVGYNTFGEVTAARNADGELSQVTTDRLGRPLTTTAPSHERPDGVTVTAVTEVAYDAVGRIVAETDPMGRTTEYRYDQLGHPVLRIDPPAESSSPLSTGHGVTGLLGRPADRLVPSAELTSPLITDSEAFGPPVTTTDGRGIHRYTWTPTGLQLSAVDPTGARVEATYDELGRQLTSTVVERHPELVHLTTDYRWDAAGNRTATVLPGTGSRYSNTTEYNAAGEPVLVYDAWVDLAQYEYDDFGRRIALTAHEKHRTVFHHDHVGNVVRVDEYGAEEDVQRSTLMEFDAAGNRTALVSPTGIRRTYRHDALGRLTEQNEPVNGTETITTTFGHDAAGNRTRLTDGRGNTTHYTFTPAGLLESTIEAATDAHPDPADRTWTVLHDEAGQPVTTWLPGGVVRERTYDGLGRLVRETGSGAEAPTEERRFTYDLAGRMTSQGTEALGTNTYTYNDRGVLLTATGPGGNVAYSYTRAGQMASRTDARGTTTFLYNYAGDLSHVSDGAMGAEVWYSHDLTGRPISEGYELPTDEDDEDPNATKAGEQASALSWRPEYDAERVYHYDTLGQLVGDQLFDGNEDDEDSEELAAVEYEYGLDGQLIRKSTRGFAGEGTDDYTYDDAGRLTSWTRDGTTVAYAWDASGNRIRHGEETAAYDERNRLLADGERTYTYTPRGTLTTVTAPDEADRALTFDAFERKVTDGDTPFRYDSLDRVTHHGNTRFTYDGGSSNLLFDGTTHYVRNPGGGLLASVNGANEEGRWLITDQHTDVIAGFSLDGAELVGSRAFDPFGRSLAEDGTNPAVGYQSGWTDPESGDVNMAARWYQPGTGAFASRDTSLLDPTPSVHANRYTYGAGSPLMYVDPDGHAAVCATVVTAPACAGGAAGSFFGPWGTAIGAGAGLAVGGVLAWNKYMGGASSSSSSGSANVFGNNNSALAKATRQQAQRQAAAAQAFAWAAELNFLWRSQANASRSSTSRTGGRSYCTVGCGTNGRYSPSPPGGRPGYVSAALGAGGSRKSSPVVRYIPPQNPNRGPNPVPAPDLPAPRPDYDRDAGEWDPTKGWSSEITVDDVVAYFESEAYDPEALMTVDTPGGKNGGRNREDGLCDVGPGVGYRGHQLYMPRERYLDMYDSDVPQEQCRATGVVARLDKGDHNPRRRAPGTNTNGYTQPPGLREIEKQGHNFANGHLVSAAAHGSGIDLRNLVAEYQKTNMPYLSAGIEAEIWRNFTKDKVTYLSVVPVYERPNSGVPTKLVYSYSVPEEGMSKVCIVTQNPNGGTTTGSPTCPRYQQ
ncbi:hypothetical protein GCM10009716_27230 [Streptomyces sodiiphilus]|uniref:Laminin G domain-containing protein n=1 Tax=Streptomyces sodiiphilus TaxID=226217 RepID=A0ABP5AMI8_9ACTN